MSYIHDEMSGLGLITFLLGAIVVIEVYISEELAREGK